MTLTKPFLLGVHEVTRANLAHVVLHSDAEDSARFKNVRIAATREAPVKAKAVTGKVE